MRKKLRRRKTVSWKAIDYVSKRKHRGLPPLSSAQVAYGIGVKPGSLSRAFKREFNMRFCDFMKRSKLWSFDELLKKEPDTHLKELIARMDYESHKYFKKQFKKLYGMTPSERRKYHKMKVEINECKSSE